MNGSIFFRSLSPLARTLVVGTIAYAVLVVLLRLSGKRAIAKMNIFDFVVTVALGSTLANVITDADIDLATGITALVLLVGVQYAISWSASHSARFEKWINGRPTLLLYRDPAAGARTAILNIAGMGPFSSDRTILEYAERIWNVAPMR